MHRRENRKSQKLSPLSKMVENLPSLIIHSDWVLYTDIALITSIAISAFKY